MFKKITIFTDADLDGAGCVLIFKWLFPNTTITHKAVNERTFTEAFNAFLKTEDFKKVDSVYVCDLNVIEKSFNILNHPKVHYIDHHDEPINVPENKNLGSLIREPSPSCTSLVYKILKPLSNINLGSYQKLLIALIDDYDSYTLKHPTSLNLNTVFYALQGDRINLFCNKFNEGFKGFDNHQNNIIRFYTLKVNEILKNLEVYYANVPLGGQHYKIVSTFADFAINEVAQYILNKHEADISIVINTKNNTVSFRKQKSVTYNISLLAKRIADGEGNSNAAGGKLTEQMLLFSRMFKPV